MLKIENDKLTIDVEKAMSNSFSEVIDEIHKGIVSFVSKSAVKSTQLTTVRDDIVYENKPKWKFVKDESLLKGMTVADFVELNKMALDANDYINSLESFVISITVTDDTIIRESVRKQYPELTDSDFERIMRSARTIENLNFETKNNDELLRRANEWIMTVDSLMKLACELKGK